MLCVAAIALKLLIIPQTVPNNPTSGATEPVDAKKPIRVSSSSSSLSIETIIAFSIRCCRETPRKPRSVLDFIIFVRFHSFIAATNIADIGSLGRLPIESYKRSREPPDQKVSSNFLESCLTWRSVPNFSIIIAQDQTEAAIKPIITTLVTISEAQTKSHIDIWLAVFTTSVKACVSIIFNPLQKKLPDSCRQLNTNY